MEQLLKDLREMSALDGDASLEKAKEIASKYSSAEEKAFIQQYMDNELDKIEKEIDEVDKKLDRYLSLQD